MSLPPEDPYPIPFNPEVVLRAYSEGFFPMAENQKDWIRWYRPDPRAIFPLKDFHVPTSLKRFMKRRSYEVEWNRNFEQVMRYCQNREEGSWISEEMIEVYSELNHMGFTHSLEVKHEGKLCGGLYGVRLGGAFFGESMFTLKSNFSKVALVELVKKMKEKKMILLDAQFHNAHLEQFNLKMISDQDYIQLLKKALILKVNFP